MDSNLIYTKTSSGEEAMYQRTRVMQRNVRMILILVDGQSTVADLCVKTGNRQLTESALADLEKGGFIELRVEQDSIWAESKKVAQEIRAAAVDKAMEFSRNKDSKDKAQPSSLPDSDAVVAARSEPGSSVSASLSGAISSPFSLVPGTHKRISEDGPIPKAPRPTDSEEGSSTERSGKVRHSLLARARGLFARSNHEHKPPITKDVKAKRIEPRRSRRRESISWSRVLLYGVIGVFLALVLAVAFFPLERFLPEVEAALSDLSGRPVKVGAMHFEIYPKPGLFLLEVHAGSGRGEVRINEIRLQPDVLSLTESKRVFSDALLSGVSVSPDFVAGLPRVFSGMSRADSAVVVKHVRFEKVDVSFAGLSVPEMEGEVQPTNAGEFQSLALWLSDRTLKADLKPNGEKIDVSLEGIAWRPSQTSHVVIDSLNLKGSVDRGTFAISDLDVHAFDGAIKAKGSAVERADGMSSISGDLSFERINAARLGEALGVGSQFSGEVAGKLSFSTIADAAGGFLSAISGDGDFSIRRGRMREVDLVETMRRASGTPVMGGETPFDQLSGKVKLTPTKSVFSGLILNSGLIQATGSVDVGKDLGTSGYIQLQVRGSVNQSRVPITIKGPLNAPALQLGRSN